MHNKVQRGGAAIAAISLLFTVLGGLLLQSTAGAAITRPGGVKGISLNGTGGGDGLSYLGLYGITDPSGKKKTAVCIKWEGAAPSDNAGAFLDGGSTDDPILSALAYYIENQPSWLAGNEIQYAGIATVAKYRSSQLGLVGATSYPAGLPNPTGPADFRLTGNGSTYNGNVPVSSAQLADTAWDLWKSMVNTGRDFGFQQVSKTAHPGVNGGTIDMRFRLLNSTLSPVKTWVVGVNGLVNATAEFWTPNFGSEVPGGRVGHRPER